MHEWTTNSPPSKCARRLAADILGPPAGCSKVGCNGRTPQLCVCVCVEGAFGEKATLLWSYMALGHKNNWFLTMLLTETLPLAWEVLRAWWWAASVGMVNWHCGPPCMSPSHANTVSGSLIICLTQTDRLVLGRDTLTTTWRENMQVNLGLQAKLGSKSQIMPLLTKLASFGDIVDLSIVMKFCPSPVHLPVWIHLKSRGEALTVAVVRAQSVCVCVGFPRIWNVGRTIALVVSAAWLHNGNLSLSIVREHDDVMLINIHDITCHMIGRGGYLTYSGKIVMKKLLSS